MSILVSLRGPTNIDRISWYSIFANTIILEKQTETFNHGTLSRDYWFAKWKVLHVSCSYINGAFCRTNLLKLYGFFTWYKLCPLWVKLKIFWITYFDSFFVKWRQIVSNVISLFKSLNKILVMVSFVNGWGMHWSVIVCFSN